MNMHVDDVQEKLENVDSEHLADALLEIGRFFHDLTPARTELGTLTLRQIEVLDQITIQGGLTLAALAERIGLANSTMSTMVDRMVRDGLVDRKVNPDNRREVILNLGEKGVEYQRLRREIIQETMLKMMGGLSNDQRTLLLKALYMIGQLIHDLKGGADS